MKNIIFILLLFFVFSCETNKIQNESKPKPIPQAINNELYLIYDPLIQNLGTRDLSLYTVIKDPTFRQIYQEKDVLSGGTILFNFEIPLLCGNSVRAEVNEQIPPVIIPLNQVLTLYPQAKTILQLETFLLPGITTDINNMGGANRKSHHEHASTLYPNNCLYWQQVWENIYVIDLQHPQNRAVIYKVDMKGI